MSLGTQPLVFDDEVFGAARHGTSMTIELAAAGFVGTLKLGSRSLLLKLGSAATVETRKLQAFTVPQASR